VRTSNNPPAVRERQLERIFQLLGEYQRNSEAPLGCNYLMRELG
jgi:hypothetical protein